MAEQKLERQRRRAAAVRSLEEALTAFARGRGGRFILYGSAATGRMADHSDVDLIVDFPTEHRREALDFAEDEMWRLGLLPDIRPRDYCSDAFLARVLSEGRVLE